MLLMTISHLRPVRHVGNIITTSAKDVLSGVFCPFVALRSVSFRMYKILFNCITIDLDLNFG